MSGIAGIVNLDGAPIEVATLRRMTDSLAFRGPDAQNTWVDSQAGFGHALLRTTDEAEHEVQPLTLDGKVFIVADARVDARSDLIAGLKSKSQEAAPGVPDVELILRAYQAWGEDCVEHLLGDFAFAIWDAPRRRLFCARDHLGVKPFFYAQVGSTVVFSNTLDTVRIHPAVSDRLNDLAIADFLLFDCNQEFGTTVYADIRRLPSAHAASWSPDGFSLKRYWTLPIDEPIYYRRSSDYVERFRELLNTAVEDRLRTNRLAVFMSGGLDSTTLAATACAAFRRWGMDFELHAFTSVADAYTDDRSHAAMVAEHLGIPIHLQVYCGDVIVDPNWRRTSFHTPEPVKNPVNLESVSAWFQQVSSHSRVFFWGEGPDNALTHEWAPYLKYLIRRGRYFQALVDICRHVISHRRIPLLGTIPRMVRQRFHRDDKEPSFPAWLNPDFQSRCDLRTRWAAQYAREKKLVSPHLVRPRAYESFTGPLWPALFESLDSANTGLALESRHPFVDLRLLRYMLRVPAMPWCRVKFLERDAMRGILPESVRRHPKMIPRRDSLWDHLRGSRLPDLLSSQTRTYVCPERLPELAGDDTVAFEMDLAARALDYWLTNRCITSRLEGREGSKS
ncbi:MAG: asparagine synthase-related protein [Candidatus Binataceae bacterium]